jgi:hypothetical protein
MTSEGGNVNSGTKLVQRGLLFTDGAGAPVPELVTNVSQSRQGDF